MLLVGRCFGAFPSSSFSLNAAAASVLCVGVAPLISNVVNPPPPADAVSGTIHSVAGWLLGGCLLGGGGL